MFFSDLFRLQISASNPTCFGAFLWNFRFEKNAACNVGKFIRNISVAGNASEERIFKLYHSNTNARCWMFYIQLDFVLGWGMNNAFTSTFQIRFWIGVSLVEEFLQTTALRHVKCLTLERGSSVYSAVHQINTKLILTDVWAYILLNFYFHSVPQRNPIEIELSIFKEFSLWEGYLPRAPP